MRDEWTREWQAELAALGDVRPDTGVRSVAHGARFQTHSGCGRASPTSTGSTMCAMAWGSSDSTRALRRQRSAFSPSASPQPSRCSASLIRFCCARSMLPGADRIVTLSETRASDDEPLEVAPGNLIDWRTARQIVRPSRASSPGRWISPEWRGRRSGFRRRSPKASSRASRVTPLLGRFFGPGEYPKGPRRRSRARRSVLAPAFRW